MIKVRLRGPESRNAVCRPRRCQRGPGAESTAAPQGGARRRQGAHARNTLAKRHSGLGLRSTYTFEVDATPLAVTAEAEAVAARSPAHRTSSLPELWQRVHNETARSLQDDSVRGWLSFRRPSPALLQTAKGRTPSPPALSGAALRSRKDAAHNMSASDACGAAWSRPDVPPCALPLELSPASYAAAVRHRRGLHMPRWEAALQRLVVHCNAFTAGGGGQTPDHVQSCSAGAA